MGLYLISYDIAEKDAFEYEGLWGKLKSIGASKILYSEWVVVGNDATELYDSLAPHIQEKDRLLVQELASNARWDKLMISDEAFTRMVEKNARC